MIKSPIFGHPNAILVTLFAEACGSTIIMELVGRHRRTSLNFLLCIPLVCHVPSPGGRSGAGYSFRCAGVGVDCDGVCYSVVCGPPRPPLVP